MVDSLLWTDLSTKENFTRVQKLHELTSNFEVGG
jgi:hypothetical protein